MSLCQVYGVGAFTVIVASITSSGQSSSMKASTCWANVEGPSRLCQLARNTGLSRKLMVVANGLARR